MHLLRYRRSCSPRHRQWVCLPDPFNRPPLDGERPRLPLRLPSIDPGKPLPKSCRWLTGLRSGMCKAGFAGDDAPRAVFRKCHA